MKLFRTFIAFSVLVCISATSAFAAPNSSSALNICGGRSEALNTCEKGADNNCERKKHQDPIKMLQEKKEKVREMLKEGKITKEQADAKISKIDARIKRIEEFNKLPLSEKKVKLISNFKAAMDRKVKDGKLTQSEAEEIIKEFTGKVEKWDGKGYPGFLGKSFK